MSRQFGGGIGEMESGWSVSHPSILHCLLVTVGCRHTENINADDLYGSDAPEIVMTFLWHVISMHTDGDSSTHITRHAWESNMNELVNASMSDMVGLRTKTAAQGGGPEPGPELGPEPEPQA